MISRTVSPGESRPRRSPSQPPGLPGDGAVHNSCVVHGTGPNETARRRRGWTVHYVKAEAKWGDYRDDPDAMPYTAMQTPDGLHLRDGRIVGNRDYLLVSGQASPAARNRFNRARSGAGLALRRR